MSPFLKTTVPLAMILPVPVTIWALLIAQGGAVSGPLAATGLNIEPRGAISSIVDSAAIERHSLRKAFRIRGTGLGSLARAQRCFDISRASYKCGTKACCAVIKRTGVCACSAASPDPNPVSTAGRGNVYQRCRDGQLRQAAEPCQKGEGPRRSKSFVSDRPKVFDLIWNRVVNIAAKAAILIDPQIVIPATQNTNLGLISNLYRQW